MLVEREKKSFEVTTETFNKNVQQNASDLEG